MRCRKEHSLDHVRDAVSQGKTRCDCTSCGASCIQPVFQYMLIDRNDTALCWLMRTAGHNVCVKHRPAVTCQLLLLVAV